MKAKLYFTFITHFLCKKLSNLLFFALLGGVMISFPLSTFSQTYCTTGLYVDGCTVGDDIGTVIFNTINNITTTCPGSNGYSDYTSMSTVVNKGLSYNITVGTSSAIYDQGFGVWIDFNQDGDWDDPGEFVYASPIASTNPFTGTITIPPTAYSGATRMRVRASYANVVTASESCTNIFFGEAEDYTVVILGGAANDAAITSIDSPYAFCAGTYNIVATLQNFGNNQLTSASVNWTFDGVAQTTYNWTGSLDTLGGSNPNNVQLTLGTKTFAANSTHVIKVWSSNPNGVLDTTNFNDTATVTVKPSLSGTFTIGGTSPDYSTFSAAAADLNNFGICGPVTFNVRPGTYNEQVSLDQVAGTSATNPIVFKSENGDSTSVILTYSSTSTNNYVFRINGTNYVTVKNMTIQATNMSYGRVINIFNGSSNTIISNNRLTGSSVLSTSNNVAVVFSSGSNNNTLITNNVIRNGGHGIYMYGTSTSSLQQGSVVSNNNIETYYYGIYFYYQDAPEAISNIIATTNATFGYGIYSNYVNNALIYEKNKIQLLGGYGMYMGYNVASSLNKGLVVNNMISIGGTGTAYGMYMFGSTAYQDVVYNSINVRGSSTGGRALYITASGSDIDIINNILANTASGYAYYVSSGAVDVSNYNDIYSAGSPLAYWNSTASSLSALQALSGKDQNSVSIDPAFYSLTNLHVTSGGVNNIGLPITGITTDIDGELRDLTNPDIGADEFTPPPNDLAFLGFSKPASFGCDATDSTEICVVIFNNGSAPQSNFVVSAKIYSVLVATATVTATIQPGDSLIYCFTNKVDLSTPGLYPFTGWVLNVGDTINMNDTLLGHPVNVDTLITSFPYFIDFEDPAGSLPPNWTNDSEDSGEDWNFAPTVGFTTVNGISFDHTLGTTAGYYGWVDNSSPHSSATNLISPCMDITINNPYLEFFLWNTDQNNSILLHIDVLHNGIWQNDIVAPLGYQSLDSWERQLINLQQFFGSTIKIRFRVEEPTNATTQDLGIDDIKIFSLPPYNTGVTKLLTPVTGCGLSDIETVSVVIEQVGYDTLFPGNQIPVYFQVNNGAISSEIFTLGSNDTLAQFDTIIYTFNNIANLVNSGNYTFKAWTGYPGDDDHTNDSVTIEIVNIPIIGSFPYSEDFESGQGGWVAGGTNSSWAYGTPGANVINSAASGTKAWGTGNLTGNYNPSENSEVMSPCFDFTNLNKPQIVLKIWHHSESSYDGAVLQSSIDAGQTWQNVGSFGDQINWYNASNLIGNPGGQPTGWAGTTQSNWKTAKHALLGLGGQPAVRFRIAFASDPSVHYNGFAFDDVVIGETPITGLPDSISDCGYVVLNAQNPGANFTWSTGATTQEIIIQSGSSTISQVITLTVVDPLGLYVNDTVVVNLAPGPYVNLGADTLVCGASELILDAGNPGMSYAWCNGASSQTLSVTQDGTYCVAVSDGMGCIKGDTITVQFQDFPTASFQSIPSSMLVYNFDNTSIGGNSYYWDFGDGYFSFNQDPSHVYASTGTYDVMLIVSNDCGNDTIVNTITVTIGIDEVNNNISLIDIYPNPGNGIFNVELHLYQQDNIELHILDLQGRLILNKELGNVSGKVLERMNVSELAKGVYFLQVESDHGTITKKLIIQ